MPAAELVLEDDLLNRLPQEASARVIEIVANASGNGTLDELFKNKTLKKAATKDGEFSNPQLSAISATASIMQDKLIALLGGMVAILHQQTVRSDERLAQATKNSSLVRQFLREEMFSLRQAPAAEPHEEGGGDPNDGNVLTEPPRSILTWGNFLGLSALVLGAVALYFTQAYTHFKDIAEERGTRIETLKSDIDGLNAELELMRGQRDEARTKKVMVDALAESYKQERDEAIATKGVDPSGLQDALNAKVEELSGWKVKEAEARTQLIAMTEKKDLFSSNYYAQKELAEKLQQKVDNYKMLIADLRSKGIID